MHKAHDAKVQNIRRLRILSKKAPTFSISGARTRTPYRLPYIITRGGKLSLPTERENVKQAEIL